MNAVSELTERIEQLSDEVGCLTKSLQERPIKWVTEIHDLGDAGYHLKKPVLVVIEEYPDDETVIARFPEVGAMGEGETEAEALGQLKWSILDLLEDLEASEPDELGELPQSWLRILQRLISRA